MPRSATSPRALCLLVLTCALACASKPIGQATDQDAGAQLVLAPGESRRIPEIDRTVSFDALIEDSRCPTGVTCIREGDAAVRIRIEKPGASASTYTLHTGGPGGRDATDGDVIVRLVDVKPYPAGDSRPRPDEYRVTLLILRK
jgi:hypothetical protein